MNLMTIFFVRNRSDNFMMDFDIDSCINDDEASFIVQSTVEKNQNFDINAKCVFLRISQKLTMDSVNL